MIRKARISDISQIQRLINFFADKDLMLPRSLNELYENLRDFWVYVEEKPEVSTEGGSAYGRRNQKTENKILGCCALHISWEDLAEIKSLAVEKSHQRKGIGSVLVEASLREAKELGAKKIFVLTYNPDYFKKFGFKKISKEELPHRIWAECINCPKFPDCEEIAMIKEI